MAIRSFASGQDIYSIGGEFPGSKDYVVGKIDFLAAQANVERSEQEEDEEQEETVRYRGQQVKALPVRSIAEQSTAIEPQYVVLRMPKDLFDFWCKARKHVLEDDRDELDEALSVRLAELLQKHERDGLLIRHLFANKRQVPHHDDVEPVAAVMASLLSELGDEQAERREARRERANGSAARAQA